MHIYHVTTRDSWEAALATGAYAAPSLYTEGFIHCSKAHQVAGVLERYFKGQSNLVRLTIDPEKLKEKLVYEEAPSVGEDFPHVYGTINTDAVIAVDEL
jgi:uncharacterized protein (DUF952 family)